MLKIWTHCVKVIDTLSVEVKILQMHLPLALVVL